MSQSPPNNYICRICNIPGHWIQQCPYKYHPILSQVPSNYVCHKCGIPGHWIQNCPNNHRYNNQQYGYHNIKFDNNVSNKNYRLQNQHNRGLIGIPPSNWAMNNSLSNGLENYYNNKGQNPAPQNCPNQQSVLKTSPPSYIYNKHNETAHETNKDEEKTMNMRGHWIQSRSDDDYSYMHNTSDSSSNSSDDCPPRYALLILDGIKVDKTMTSIQPIERTHILFSGYFRNSREILGKDIPDDIQHLIILYQKISLIFAIGSNECGKLGVVSSSGWIYIMIIYSQFL